MPLHCMMFTCMMPPKYFHAAKGGITFEVQGRKPGKTQKAPWHFPDLTSTDDITNMLLLSQDMRDSIGKTPGVMMHGAKRLTGSAVFHFEKVSRPANSPL